MLVSEILDDAITVAGFDVDANTTGLRWLNDRHRRMVAEARWLRKTLDVGPSVAGQESYAMPAGVVELYELTIGGSDYVKGRRQDLIAGRQSRLVLAGDGGVFTPDADAAGEARLTIYPTVDAGLAMSAYAAVLPDDLGLGDTPLIPADFAQALVEGVVATGLALDPEQLGAADRFEARFASEVERLRRLARRRFRGPGPVQIRVQGVNA